MQIFLKLALQFSKFQIFGVAERNRRQFARIRGDFLRQRSNFRCGAFMIIKIHNGLEIKRDAKI